MSRGRDDDSTIIGTLIRIGLCVAFIGAGLWLGNLVVQSKTAPAEINRENIGPHAIACAEIGEHFERCETDEVTCYRYNLGELTCRWKDDEASDHFESALPQADPLWGFPGAGLGQSSTIITYP